MRFALRLFLPRIVLSAITLLVLSLVIFWAVEWLPGDPATRILGRDATPARVAQLRHLMHLDDPPLVRYTRWLTGFAQGDWGNSLVASRAVMDFVVPRLRNTMILAGLALALYVPLSLILGIVTAVYRQRAFATWLLVVALIGTSVPEFVVGILLMLAFAVALPWFPPVAMIDRVRSIPELLHTLTLPTLTLTAAMTAYAVRMMQSSLLSVLESEYVRMATLKGLPRSRVVLRHALPNALGPALRVTALQIAWLIGGVVLVEAVFTYPGIGTLLVESIRVLDTPVIEAIAMILATIYVLANFGADLFSGLLNPRLRSN